MPLKAGIWGASHQSVLEATDAEFAQIMLTNTFGPMRLARRLLERLVMPGGTLAFMSSHRGSISINVEGDLELYRASKAALNMLACGIYAENRDKGLTVLSVHPGWVVIGIKIGFAIRAIQPDTFRPRDMDRCIVKQPIGWPEQRRRRPQAEGSTALVYRVASATF
jgi:NAD(P)-dependent dehydrogenase (short-subunit alcohol dehydrogenase family)